MKQIQKMSAPSPIPSTPGPGASLKGKVALITGASSGIGAGVARYFASLGFRLALTGRNTDNLHAVVEECIERGLEGDQILTIQANFEVEGDVKKTADQTIQKFNQLDVLVNNAGIASLDSLETLKLETFDTTFAVNVRAPLYLTHLLAPYLIASKVSTEVHGPCVAPLATMEDVDDILISPSPSLFSMPPFDDVIKRMTSTNQNADTTDPNDYDGESITMSEFNEDSISLSWATSFSSSTDIDDRLNQTPTDIVSESDDDEVDDEAVEPCPMKQEKNKPLSIIKGFRKRLRRYRERRDRKKPKGWVWWTPEGTLCVCDENGDFYQEHHVVDKMRFRRGGTEILRYWVPQECRCSD
nr:uncharacterized oxidoreductase YvaG-like [Lytechinus pictus]